MILYPNIDPVALSLGPLKIHWYGLMYLAGFVGAWFYGLQRTKREDLDWTRKQVEDVIFFGAMGVILGGRLGYTLFYNFSSFMENPLSLFYIWQGGMSFHGGMLGVFIGLYLYGRKMEKHFSRSLILLHRGCRSDWAPVVSVILLIKSCGAGPWIQ